MGRFGTPWACARLPNKARPSTARIRYDLFMLPSSTKGYFLERSLFDFGTILGHLLTQVSSRPQPLARVS